MRVVCPSCDVPPRLDATAGSACAACGTLLLQVKDEEDLIGKVIDERFEILARLGKGGMGTVYRAKQRSIGREVALKVIDRRFADDVTAVKRFLREAKLASQLSHPNTVGVIEFGQDKDSRLYLAMELVKGHTLHAVLQRDGAMSLGRIVRIGVQLCDALEAAHALSIVHRDLKHENVMVLASPSDRDLVKVLDFGLARLLDESPDSRATATGIIAGSPRYLPPEVAIDGAPPAPAQDLYALGVMLAEMATNRPLWDAPTIDGLFAQKIGGKLKLDAIDPALRKLVEDLLGPPEKRPSAKDTRTRLLAIDGATPTKRVTSSVGHDATLAGPPSVRLSAEAPDPAALAAPSSSAFAPGGGIPEFGPGAAAAALDTEPEFEIERQARRDARNRPPPKRPLKVMGIVAALIAVGIVTTGIVMIMKQQKAPRHHAELPMTEGTVSIELRSNPPAQIRIDGNKAGKTPLTLHIPKSAKPVMIEAVLMGHPITKQVIPDRDQTVDFVP
ncbi:MAG: serine/threonine protein kinase [Myxococcales bacterium]|nr:serine/threonine protein kinase [Myxococcales bacterium]